MADRLSVLVLVTDGSPAIEPVLVHLMREGFEVEVQSAEAMEAGNPVAGVVLLWTNGGLGVADCERAVAWSRRQEDVGLVGCAPLGTSLDCERALAAGFDDFMAGRGSPRELAARVRSVARRIGEPRNRCRLVAVGSGARHVRSGA